MRRNHKWSLKWNICRLRGVMGVGMAPLMRDNLTKKFIFLYLYVVVCLYEFIMQGICIFFKEKASKVIYCFINTLKLLLAFFRFSVIILMNWNVQFMHNFKVAFYSQIYSNRLLRLLVKHNVVLLLEFSWFNLSGMSVCLVVYKSRNGFDHFEDQLSKHEGCF